MIKLGKASVETRQIKKVLPLESQQTFKRDPND